jgi:hypothetical protein
MIDSRKLVITPSDYEMLFNSLNGGIITRKVRRKNQRK